MNQDCHDIKIAVMIPSYKVSRQISKVIASLPDFIDHI